MLERPFIEDDRLLARILLETPIENLETVVMGLPASERHRIFEAAERQCIKHGLIEAKPPK